MRSTTWDLFVTVIFLFINTIIIVIGGPVQSSLTPPQEHDLYGWSHDSYQILNHFLNDLDATITTGTITATNKQIMKDSGHKRD